MKFPSMILLAILHMQGIFTHLKDQDLIETTCGNTPNYQLCLSTLGSNPCSATADVEGLGLIMVDAVKHTADTGRWTANQLRQIHPELRGPLEQCWMAYDAILKADVPEAVAGLRKGDPKFAESGMADAAWEAEICEGSFRTESPLSGVNRDLRQLAEVAVAIIRNLL